VEITISENALKAHRAHQHGEDLIGVPTGGCPGGSPAAAAERSKAGEHGKVTLCHATGSETNPFVSITVALPALAAHTRHQHGEDLVGVTGPCPGAGTAAQIAVEAAVPANDAAGTPAPGAGAAPAGGDPAAGARPTTAVAGVSDESANRPAAATSADPARSGERGDDAGSLPFTGFALILIAVLGVASLLVGTHIRRTAGRAD
jgi:hypothetical protein